MVETDPGNRTICIPYPSLTYRAPLSYLNTSHFKGFILITPLRGYTNPTRGGKGLKDIQGPVSSSWRQVKREQTHWGRIQTYSTGFCKRGWSRLPETAGLCAEPGWGEGLVSFSRTGTRGGERRAGSDQGKVTEGPTHSQGSTLLTLQGLWVRAEWSEQAQAPYHSSPPAKWTLTTRPPIPPRTLL